jgi:hypothetical protein
MLRILRYIFRAVEKMKHGGGSITTNCTNCLTNRETWSLTVREQHKLRVFENRTLRRIFGPKRDAVTGGCRKLYNEELHNLYFSPGIIRIIGRGG